METPRRLSEHVKKEKLEQKFFEPIVEGIFSPEQIEIERTGPGETLKRTPESEEFIDNEWQKVQQAGFKPWPNDTKPSRYRFAGAKVENGKLVLKLDPCVSYRDAIGTRPHEFAEQFGSEYAPNPVAVTTILIARDRKGVEHMLMTLRNEKHDFKPGGYHISVGGFMEIKKDQSPFDTCVREMKEEVGLEPSELRDVVCHGVVKHPHQSSTEVIFEARTDIPLEEILERAHDDENNVVSITTTPSELRRWIVVPTFANVCVTSAAILMVGTGLVNTQRQRGEGAADPAQWRNEMLDILAGRSEQWEEADASARSELEKRDVTRLRNMVAYSRDAH